jgi:tetratricopeptide (TPR) repeat protein
MTRSVAITDHRRLRWAAALLPLALAACGKDDPQPIDLALTPVEQPKAVPAGGLPPRSTSPVISTPGSVAEAESAYKEGKYAESKRYFESHVTTKPDDPWGHYMLGLAAAKTGDLALAEQAFETALELDPKHVKTYLNLARVLLDLGRNGEGLELSEAALELDSTSSDGFRLKARAQAKLGDLAGAIATYREALVADDEDVWSMNNLGLVYLDQDKPAEALGPLARAVQLKGTAPVFQNNLGMALERAGFPVAAKQAYERAVKAQIGYAKAVKNLERIKAIVSDSAIDAGVNLEEMADVFRMQVRMWKDSALQPVKESPRADPNPMARDTVPAPPDTARAGSR